MEFQLKKNICILILMTRACIGYTSLVKNNYFEKRSAFEGSLAVLRNELTFMECGNSCFSDDQCKALEYSPEEKSCKLIHGPSTDSTQTFNQNSLYVKVKRHILHEPLFTQWTTKDQPVFHEDFEDTTGMIIHNEVSFFSGKVGKAITVDNEMRQWVDLGDLSGVVCMVKPSTCGAGGSLSVWIRTSFPGGSRIKGLISSRSDSREGFMLYWYRGDFRFTLLVIGNAGRFSIIIPEEEIPTDWFYIVMVYNGPLAGITAYIDGSLVGNGTEVNSQGPGTEGTGHLVLGRRYTDDDDNYGPCEVDELIFWNRILSPDDVMQILSLY